MRSFGKPQDDTIRGGQPRNKNPPYEILRVAQDDKEGGDKRNKLKSKIPRWVRWVLDYAREDTKKGCREAEQTKSKTPKRVHKSQS